MAARCYECDHGPPQQTVVQGPCTRQQGGSALSRPKLGHLPAGRGRNSSLYHAGSVFSDGEGSVDRPRFYSMEYLDAINQAHRALIEARKSLSSEGFSTVERKADVLSRLSLAQASFEHLVLQQLQAHLLDELSCAENATGFVRFETEVRVSRLGASHFTQTDSTASEFYLRGSATDR